jgi:serine/threonine protein kinase
MTTRKATNVRKKRGGMIIPSEVETVGYGDTGCIYRDKHTQQLYKLIVPPKEGVEPDEVKVVEMLHNLPKSRQLDPHVFIYPSAKYQTLTIEPNVQPFLDQLDCKKVKAKILEHNVTKVYVAPIPYAGFTLKQLGELGHFHKFKTDEISNILSQLDEIVRKLKKSQLVHNDMHPGNITLTGWEGEPGERNIQVHVIDFGLMTSSVLNITDESKIVSNVIPTLKKLGTDDVIGALRGISKMASIHSIIAKLNSYSNSSSPRSSNSSRRSSSARNLYFDDMASSPPRKLKKVFDVSPIRNMSLGSPRGSPSPLILDGLYSTPLKSKSKEMGGASKTKNTKKVVATNKHVRS